MANDLMGYAIIIGFAAVGLALLDRGYLSYRQAKKSDPSLKFSFEYIVTIIIAAGGAGGFFGLILPAVQATITTPSSDELFYVWVMTQFVAGYFATVGILDKLNQPLEAKSETMKLKTAIAEGTIKTEPTEGTATGSPKF